MSWTLDGKVVFITGAARGIGAETARQLRAKGARLALAGLEPELLEQRAAELGGDVAWFELDVTDPEAIDAAVAGTVERFGGIDIVLANAGIATGGPAHLIDPADFERLIDVNLLGVWRTVRAALPHVTERSGYVLPIASLAAALHAPMMSPYCMSKAGVEAFCNCLRTEVRHTGTAVGCGYFSFIDTDMVRRGMDSAAGQKTRERLRGPLKPPPVSVAGEAIVRGMEKRSRFVYAPRWVKPALYLRTVLQPLTERGVKDADVTEAIELFRTEPSRLTTEQPSKAVRS